MVTPPADAVPTTLFSLPDDLEVTLWAKAPMLRNPSNMDIDAQGRVQLSQRSSLYPLPSEPQRLAPIS